MTKIRTPVGKLTLAWLSRRNSLVRQEPPSEQLERVVSGEPQTRRSGGQLLIPEVAPGTRWPAATFALCVLVPAIAWFVSAAWFASPEYVSESRFVLRGSVERLALEGMGQTAILSQLNNAQEAHVVADYIRSDQIVSEIGRDIDLNPVLSKINIDPRDVISLHASGDPRGERWRKIVKVETDPITGIVTVRVHGASASLARDINAEILKRSAALAARFSGPVRKVRLEEAEQDAARARQALIRILQAINGARQRENVLSPVGMATDIHDLIAKLREERAALTATQTSAQGRLDPASPAYALNEERIRSLDAQIAELIELTTSAGGEGPRKDILGAASLFDILEARKELAIRKVAQAETGLAHAQMNASRQSVYLEVFVAPTLGEQDARVHALVSALIVFLVLSACWGIAALYVHSVRERAQ